ncbi:response regulator transcription factor [Alteriqipengyuania lutimaris]|uniref:LuxR family transcriptional regulator n=1 Tax=Alteriqipengyuania lutimaris TaxID=1538146 RepID=A0A395LJD6_9SPHN|nr:LuxR C-terminal-related transcriptional regulator [Alteriqipengyuania lutimaris]MBB3034008.1 FixJ family two-component response regulator [Alteriqipengyuania lutimaris]RDS77042.1 LuxR family transcriptional regulator [Alteriqipengyuania lutimaris]
MNTIFLIDTDAERRAEVGRVLLQGGLHAEPFEASEEFVAFGAVDGGPQGLALVADTNGAAASLCERLRDDPRLVPVLAYADAPRLEHVVAAMQAGAQSYLEWPFTFAGFSEEIARIEPAMRADLERKRRSAVAQSRLARLTGREREVLASLVTHGTNKAIAKQLDISPRTVEKYRAAILVRLGVANSAQAIRIAAEGGVFDGLPADETLTDQPGSGDGDAGSVIG